MLSLRVASILSRKSNMVFVTSAWASMPACSRSLLVMSLVGFSVEMRRDWMSGGKGAHQSKGGWSAVKRTPPMPDLAASTEPMADG